MSALDYLMKELYEKVGQGLTPEEVIASWYGVEPSSLFRGMSSKVTPEEYGSVLTARDIAEDRFCTTKPETPEEELAEHLCEHGDWKEVCILCRDDD